MRCVISFIKVENFKTFSSRPRTRLLFLRSLNTKTQSFKTTSLIKRQTANSKHVSMISSKPETDLHTINNQRTMMKYGNQSAEVLTEQQNNS